MGEFETKLPAIGPVGRLRWRFGPSKIRRSASPLQRGCFDMHKLKFGPLIKASAFTAAVFSIAAHAAETPAKADAPAKAPAPSDLYTNMDFDADGRVNREELRNFMARLFTAQDDNADGTLSPKEMPKALGPDGKPIKEEKVKVEDMIAASDVAFDNVDNNKDGYLSREELKIPPAAAKSN